MKAKTIVLTAFVCVACLFGFSACSNSDEESLTKGINGETIPALPKMKVVERGQLEALFGSSTPMYLRVVEPFKSFHCDLANQKLKDGWVSAEMLDGYVSMFPNDAFISDGVLSINIFQLSDNPHPLYAAWERYCYDMGHPIKIYHKIPTVFNKEDLTLDLTLISNCGHKGVVRFNIYGYSGKELSMYRLSRCANYNISGTEIAPTYFLDLGTYDTSGEMKKDNGYNLYFDTDRDAREYMLKTLRGKYGQFVPLTPNPNASYDKNYEDLDEIEKELSIWDSVWD